MKRNDKVKLQLHIESKETIKNKETGTIEVRKRSIAKSLDVIYVNLSSFAFTEQLGKIRLAIKYKGEHELEYVELNHININAINDIHKVLKEVLLLGDNRMLHLVRDVFIIDNDDDVIIKYKDTGSEEVELKFDKIDIREAAM